MTTVDECAILAHIKFAPALPPPRKKLGKTVGIQHQASIADVEASIEWLPRARNGERGLGAK
jgi:hypothetical protein